jgi:hypothetical protein
MTAHKLALILCIFPLSLAGDELLRYQEPDRMSGPEVLKMQKLLLHGGFALGPEGVDGWFGPNTERALKAWQNREGQTVTGEYSPTEVPLDLYWQPLFFYSRLEDVDIEDPLLIFRPQAGERIYTYYGVIEILSSTEGLFVAFWGSENSIALSGRTVNISPNGRFIAALQLSEDRSFYHGLQIIDLLSEKRLLPFIGRAPHPRGSGRKGPIPVLEDPLDSAE